MEDLINDCFFDIFNKKPSQLQIEQITKSIPSYIEFLAEQWGWNDTEVGDMTYKWIKENGGKL
jgi:hypothetical protein